MFAKCSKVPKKTGRNAVILLATLIAVNIYTSNFHLQEQHIHFADTAHTLSNYNLLSEEEDTDLEANLTFQVVDGGGLRDAAHENENENKLLMKKEPQYTSMPQEERLCDFLAEDEGPIPVILFSFGRSGSSITWNVMSNLTGHTNRAHEAVRTYDQFLEEFVNNTNNTSHSWARDKLCNIQHIRWRESGKSHGIAGFQWKPNYSIMRHEYTSEALKRVADQRNPTVRVVILTRNFLDRLYSRMKHIKSWKNEADKPMLPDHCQVGDEKCLKRHFKNDQPIVFPTGRKLKKKLKNNQKHHEELKQLLDSLQIKYVVVSYEKLYDSDSAGEWMRIFRHLGRGPSADLTMEEVRSAMGLQRTNEKKDKWDMMSNFKDVKDTLKGTQFQHLLGW